MKIKPVRCTEQRPIVTEVPDLFMQMRCFNSENETTGFWLPHLVNKHVYIRFPAW